MTWQEKDGFLSKSDRNSNYKIWMVVIAVEHLVLLLRVVRHASYTYHTVLLYHLKSTHSVGGPAAPLARPSLALHILHQVVHARQKRRRETFSRSTTAASTAPRGASISTGD